MRWSLRTSRRVAATVWPLRCRDADVQRSASPLAAGGGRGGGGGPPVLKCGVCRSVVFNQSGYLQYCFGVWQLLWSGLRRSLAVLNQQPKNQQTNIDAARRLSTEDLTGTTRLTNRSIKPSHQTARPTKPARPIRALKCVSSAILRRLCQKCCICNTATA